MTYQPRTIDQIYESVEDRLKGKISRLTNFTRRSFNYVWTRAFASEFRELEVRVLAAELSGFIDYTGGPVTESDLSRLGVEDVDPDEVNKYLSDEFLDEYVKIVGLRRLEGSRATGTVTIQTQVAETTISQGTVVTTTTDTNGDVISFETVNDITVPQGVTEKTGVEIQATAVGDAGNVPADTIVRFESPPIGVKGVSNPSDTEGGKDRESNDELRERAKTAVQASSEGGTVAGIKGYIRQEVEGVGQGDIAIDEIFDQDIVDVIVDGGVESDIVDAIEFSRPTGIKHNFIRPKEIQLGFDVYILGDNIDIEKGVKPDIENFLLDLGVSENFYEDEIIRLIMNSDSNIINIDDLGGYIKRINNEQIRYDGSSEYRLDYTYEKTNGTITITDSEGITYGEGSDFTVEDRTGDGYPETIVWSGTTPDVGERFTVDYDVTVPGSTPTQDFYQSNEVRDESFVWNPSYQETDTYVDARSVYELDYIPFTSSFSLSDESDDSYDEGTDFDLVDTTGNGFVDSIDWSIGSKTPDDNEKFTATYTQRVFETEYDIVDSETDQIRANSGTYSEGTNYQLVSTKPNSTENNAIEWLTESTSPIDGEEFYFTYVNQGDRRVSIREKISAGSISVTEV